jgi:hypothetical protein
MGGAEEHEGHIYGGMAREYNEDAGGVDYLSLLPKVPAFMTSAILELYNTDKNQNLI